MWTYLLHEEEDLVTTAGNIVTNLLQLHLGEVKDSIAALDNTKGIAVVDPE